MIKHTRFIVMAFLLLILALSIAALLFNNKWSSAVKFINSDRFAASRIVVFIDTPGVSSFDENILKHVLKNCEYVSVSNELENRIRGLKCIPDYIISIDNRIIISLAYEYDGEKYVKIKKSAWNRIYKISDSDWLEIQNSISISPNQNLNENGT